MSNFPDSDKESVLAFVQAHKALALSTSGAQGELHCAPLYYFSEDFLSFYFVSSPTSQHSRDLVLQAKVAGAIYREGACISEITGIQFKGKCTLLTGSEAELKKRVYLNCFKEVQFNQGMLSQFEKSELYKIEVNWLRWIRMQSSGPLRREGYLGASDFFTPAEAP